MTHDIPPDRGDATGATGTPHPVDFTRDRRARLTWVLFLGGPVVWIGHFMFVYLVAEAGCTGDGPGLDLFAPPVPAILTVVATVAAAVACLTLAYANVRRHRRSGESDTDTDDTRSSLALAGALLSGLSALAVFSDGIPGLVFPAC